MPATSCRYRPACRMNSTASPRAPSSATWSLTRESEVKTSPPDERVLHHDGIVAVGTGGQERHRRADQFFHPAHILDGVGGKIGPAARALGGFLPAVQGLI